ncbi:NUDIX domain-containing protein [Streptomyces sp. NPDC055140]
MLVNEVRWAEAWPPPAGVGVRQVYGIVFDSVSGSVVVQDDNGRYNLPGGTPEPEDNADLVATLRREVHEESQLVLADWAPVGYQLVSEDGRAPYVQVRYAALLEKAYPIAPDPSTGPGLWAGAGVTGGRGRPVGLGRARRGPACGRRPHCR